MSGILLSDFIKGGGYITPQGWFCNPTMDEDLFYFIHIERDIEIDGSMPIEEQRRIANGRKAEEA